MLVLAGMLLSICFITGGNSAHSGGGVMIAQLLALPILIYAVLHGWQTQRLRPARWAIAVVLLIALIPLLQLLPIPAWLWHLPEARRALQHDLDQVGVTTIDYRWSLTPAATERDLYSLLPAIALFFSALATRHDTWRVWLWWLLGLVLFSTLLAFAQLGAGQHSMLNPFPQYAPALAGVFANRDHQASALAMGLVLALTLLLESLRDIHNPERPYAKVAVYSMLVLLFALVLPLVRSRAGVIIALVMVGAILLGSGVLARERLRTQWSTRLLAGVAGLVVMIGVCGAFAWMRFNVDVRDLRWILATTTFHLGFANAPLGSGIGSFVPMFEQATHGSLMDTGYINTAHNEYLQWWFEGGVLAVATTLAALMALFLSARRLLHLPTDSRVRSTGLAALGGILVLLLHSTVDYPLRTPALMATFGLLCGIAIAAATRAPPIAERNPEACFDTTTVYGDRKRQRRQPG